MEIILYIIGAGVLLFFFFFNKNKIEGSEHRPPLSTKPGVGQEKTNDKIVIVKNIDLEQLRKAIIDFCNLYNQNNFTALPRLFTSSNNTFVITFPYDIDFITYCFFVNYITYPIDIHYEAKVKAWTTTNSKDDWMNREIAGKKTMLFVPENDTDGDNIYLTTEDNLGYKLCFDNSQQRLDFPAQSYTIAPSSEKWKDLEGEDFC
jgi:hypothetical protein